jgi:RNA polymerase sigma factor (sigma-70 family)
MIEQSDYDLLKRIQVRDPNALEELYDRYERPMYAYAFRMMNDRMAAEEVIQELFLRIWNYAERFDERQGKVATWMFTITRNIAIDFLRRKQNRLPRDLAEQGELDRMLDQNQNTQEAVENKWVGEQVKIALGSLNPDQQQVIEWIYYQGYTHQEIADEHAIPLGTVKSRVRLACNQLKKKLSNLGWRGYRHE